MAANQISMKQAETDIAVLQNQVKNIEEKVNDIKADVKDLQKSIDEHAEITATTLKDMREASSNAHKSMADKISSLEKWRWMMMGAGVVLGTMGYDTVAKLLK